MASDLATRAGTWRGFLDRPDIQQQIAAAIRTEISPKTVARITLSNMLRNPKLMECTQASVVQAVLTACALGLEPDGVSGQAYLVPYKDVCTLIPGYRGLIQLAYRSGEVLSIQSLNVYANEKFERHVGAIPPVVHTPKPPETRGEYVGSYAVATIKGGGCVCEYLWKSEIETIRDRSASYQSAVKYGKKDSPWFTDADEMRRKTVVRRLFKYIPSSAALRQAVAMEDEFEADRATFVDMVDTPLPTTKAAKLAANMRARTPLPPPPTETEPPLGEEEGQTLGDAIEALAEDMEVDVSALDGTKPGAGRNPTPPSPVISGKRAGRLFNLISTADIAVRDPVMNQYGLSKIGLQKECHNLTEAQAEAIEDQLSPAAK
jgi:recombination protein RecT